MSGRIPGVFLSQLPWDADQGSIAEHFLRTWGVRVQGIKLIHQNDDSTSALVDLDSQEAAEQVGGEVSAAVAPLSCCASCQAALCVHGSWACMPAWRDGRYLQKRHVLLSTTRWNPPELQAAQCMHGQQAGTACKLGAALLCCVMSDIL